MREQKEYIRDHWLDVAWNVPDKLVYWCAIRIWAHASEVMTSQPIYDITIGQALQEWEKHLRGKADASQ